LIIARIIVQDLKEKSIVLTAKRKYKL